MPKVIPHDRVCLMPLESEDLPTLRRYIGKAIGSELAHARNWDRLCRMFEEGALSGDPRHIFIVRLDGMPVGYCAANFEKGVVELGLPIGTPQHPSVAEFSLRWALDLIFSIVWHHEKLTVRVTSHDEQMLAVVAKVGLKPCGDGDGDGFAITRKVWARWKEHPVRDRIEDIPQGGEALKPSAIKYTPASEDDIPFLTRLHNASFQYYNFRPLSRHAMKRRFARGEFFGDQTRVFIVRVKGEPVGIARVQDANSASPEVGLRILGPWQARGIGSPATQFLLKYCFTKLPRKPVKVRALTVAANIGGNKALLKAGFTRDGVTRRQWFIRGEWRDAALYSMLREEWEALPK